jgi:hypothetical protein
MPVLDIARLTLFGVLILLTVRPCGRPRFSKAVDSAAPPA